VIDRESGEVVKSIDVPEPGPFVVFDADGGTGYVASTGGGYVAAIDTGTYEVTELDAGTAPTVVLLPDDDQSRLFVVSDDGGSATLDAVPLG
jgi:DNA-binding beta-propeller fold protein YncE